MARTIRLIAVFASGTILLSFVVLVVNQTAQVVQLATTLHPLCGTVTLLTLLTAYSVLIGTPIVMILRLPSPLEPPLTDEGPEFDAHLGRLRKRLATNPHLKDHDLAGRMGVEAAIGVLGEKSNKIIEQAASTVFISTAISQSGRLDSLLVLAAQTRMVWSIAHLYYQRPSVKDLSYLYANVVGTAFAAGEIQDIDLSEQVEPILSSAIGALGASVPGFHTAGTVFTHCVLSGSANAFLTLRVGMIAKKYCGALVVPRKAALRRVATAEAALHLGTIVTEGSARIAKALFHASVDKVGGALTSASNYAKDTGAKLFAGLWWTRTVDPTEPG
ncbi:DUF697 domain-containing protein [Singulisphaera rosea]